MPSVCSPLPLFQQERVVNCPQRPISPPLASRGPPSSSPSPNVLVVETPGLPNVSNHVHQQRHANHRRRSTCSSTTTANPVVDRKKRPGGELTSPIGSTPQQWRKPPPSLTPPPMNLPPPQERPTAKSLATLESPAPLEASATSNSNLDESEDRESQSPILSLVPIMQVDTTLYQSFEGTQDTGPNTPSQGEQCPLSKHSAFVTGQQELSRPNKSKATAKSARFAKSRPEQLLAPVRTSSGKLSAEPSISTPTTPRMLSLVHGFGRSDCHLQDVSWTGTSLGSVTTMAKKKGAQGGEDWAYLSLVTGPLYVKYGAAYVLCDCTIDALTFSMVPRVSDYPAKEFQVASIEELKLLLQNHYFDNFMFELVIAGNTALVQSSPRSHATAPALPRNKNQSNSNNENKNQQQRATSPSKTSPRSVSPQPLPQRSSKPVPEVDRESVVDEGHPGGEGYTVLTFKAFNPSELCDWSEAVDEVSQAAASFNELSGSMNFSKKSVSGSPRTAGLPSLPAGSMSTHMMDSSHACYSDQSPTTVGHPVTSPVSPARKPILHDKHEDAKLLLPVYGCGYYTLS